MRPGRIRWGADLGAALTCLGHSVSYFDYDDQPWNIKLMPRALRFGDWQAQKRAFINSKLLLEVERLQPDIFLCMKGVQFWTDTIDAIAALGVITVGYWMDDPHQFLRSAQLATHYQHYFTMMRLRFPTIALLV